MPEHDRTTRDAFIVDVLRVMHVLAPEGLPPSQADNVRTMLMAYVPGPRQGDLFEADPHREGDRLAKLSRAMVRGEPVRHDRSLALAVKVAVTIGHVRAGRWDRLQGSEAALVAGVLGLDVPEGAGKGGRDRTTTDSRPGGGPIEFVFPWRPKNVRQEHWLGTSTAHVSLVELDAVDAPVACTLWTPDGHLALRRLGSQWLRPVLSPESWTPATASEFGYAARNGVAWRDNPFLPSPRRGLPTFHVRDLSGPQSLTPANVRSMSDARDACLLRAGQLHVIDGIVHRPTPAPLAGVCTTFLDGNPVTAPAWRIGDLCSTRDMGTFSEGVPATWFNGRPTPDLSGTDEPDQAFVAISDWIGVARLMEGAGQRRASRSEERRLPTPGELVWPSETHGAAPDVRRCLAAASDLATRLLPIAHHLGQGRAAPDPCVRLAEALAEPRASHPPGDERWASSVERLRPLCIDVLSVTWPPTDPQGAMWAFVASLTFHASEAAFGLRDEDANLASIVF